MAVRAQQSAFFGFAADLCDSSCNAALSQSKTLGRRIEVVELQCLDALVVTAEHAFAARFLHEQLFHSAATPANRLGTALLAPEASLRTDDRELRVAMPPAFPHEGARPTVDSVVNELPSHIVRPLQSGPIDGPSNRLSRDAEPGADLLQRES
jgi:hypothetical protein